VPKEVIINMKGPQMVWVPKATWRPWDPGTWKAWYNQDEKIQAYKPSLQIGHVLPKFPGWGNEN
jgi:hypothetical protein